MLALPCLILIFATGDVPTLDLTCTLSPKESRMSVSCSLDVPEGLVTGGKVEFKLGDQMSIPKVRIVKGATIADTSPVRVSQVDHDVR